MVNFNYNDTGLWNKKNCDFDFLKAINNQTNSSDNLFKRINWLVNSNNKTKYSWMSDDNTTQFVSKAKSNDFNFDFFNINLGITEKQKTSTKDNSSIDTNSLVENNSQVGSKEYIAQIVASLGYSDFDMSKYSDDDIRLDNSGRVTDVGRFHISYDEDGNATLSPVPLRLWWMGAQIHSNSFTFDKNGTLIKMTESLEDTSPGLKGSEIIDQSYTKETIYNADGSKKVTTTWANGSMEIKNYDKDGNEID